MKHAQSLDSQQEEGNCCAALPVLCTQTTAGSGSAQRSLLDLQGVGTLDSPFSPRCQQLQRAAEGSSGTPDSTDRAVPLPKLIFPSFFPFLFARLGSIPIPDTAQCSSLPHS